MLVIKVFRLDWMEVKRKAEASICSDSFRKAVKENMN